MGADQSPPLSTTGGAFSFEWIEAMKYHVFPKNVIIDGVVLFDKNRFDREGYERDMEALEDAGWFDCWETEEQRRKATLLIFFKNYGNGEWLLFLEYAELRDAQLKKTHAPIESSCALDDIAAIKAMVTQLVEERKKKSKCDTQHRKLKLSSAEAEAVYKAWHEYTSGTADCELPTKGKELRKTKRTYAECLEALGDKVVHHNNLEEKDYKLKELAPTPDTLKKIVNAGRMRKTRHPAPARNEKNAQMTHKRARK